ncbi:MAG: VOC family protein, partial [Ignavibacteriota bacterium]
MKIIITFFTFAIVLLTNCATNSKSDIKKSITNNNMTTLTNYLLLNGNCKQAMEFYKSVFNGELSMTEVGNSPMKAYFPETMHSKIVNAKLTSNRIEISASDWLRPSQTPVQGNTVCLYLSGGTPEELKTLFTKLSEGAEITDPLTEQPFGFYGALNDKFGIRWM